MSAHWETIKGYPIEYRLLNDEIDTGLHRTKSNDRHNKTTDDGQPQPPYLPLSIYAKRAF